jgi:hypothetical protein
LLLRHLIVYSKFPFGLFNRWLVDRSKQIKNLHQTRSDHNDHKKGNQSFTHGEHFLVLGSLSNGYAAPFGDIAVKFGVALTNITWKRLKSEEGYRVSVLLFRRNLFRNATTAAAPMWLVRA